MTSKYRGRVPAGINGELLEKSAAGKKLIGNPAKLVQRQLP
jgi:hypothetical protein